ncbi:COP9 signalosome complex subunit 3-like [Macrosteles quadrilineatus]|uniref:COP9 signalosome complex subunit 3-like n=1 Tax=Macrosteles quadrilineatus TaxID=74068 RepID=UPI0023E0DD9E|nr:COP9 signalosome complex subunit 3-like [Macrosteles quadrilineatus]XP_054286395.1 COP9 signalosome complex subunit 3-like [Macrosteles quadrilineatus]
MASPLEQFVNHVRTYSQQGNFRDLVNMLNKSQDVLMRNGSQLDTVLEMFDLQQHSLGMLAVLNAKLTLPPPTSSTSPPQPAIPPVAIVAPSGGGGPTDYHEILFTQAQEFIIGCNAEQVRFAAEMYANLCHQLTRVLIEMKAAIRGISLLKLAIRKIQTSEAQLTSIHADLCQLCLKAKCFKPALEFLDTDITTISEEGSQFNSKHFLAYYYYGGMIYTALKKYEQALYCLEVVITTPAYAVSHVMLEAYKKYILISLILYGKIQNVPKYMTVTVTRFIKPLSQAYHDLANACTTNNAIEAQAILTKYHDTFNRDTNIGLTKQVVASLYKKNIQRLTKTFLTLSLTDVASRVHLPSPADAEKHILNMIEDGEIFAAINQKDGMVSFHDDPEKYNTPAMLKRLEDEMSTCMDFNRHIQLMEEELVVNPQYVKKCLGAQDDDLTPTQGTKISTYSM